MKKKSTSISAFFNSRVLIGLFVVLAGVFLALLGFGTFSNASAQANLDPNAQGVGQMKVIPAVHSDLSPPLRDQPVVWPQAGEKREPHVHPRIPIRHHDRPDPVIQSSFWQQLMTTPAIPAPIRQWAGIGECELWRFRCRCRRRRIPMARLGKLNTSKWSTTLCRSLINLLAHPFLAPFPSIQFGLGLAAPCHTGGEGDPIVVYDRLADRWVISQFAQPSGADDDRKTNVSLFPRPAMPPVRGTDTTFTSRSGMQDYPKLGVWPDGYYMSAIMFDADTQRVLGAKPFVFDRAKMLVGDPTATLQTPKGYYWRGFLPTFRPGWGHSAPSR